MKPIRILLGRRSYRGAEGPPPAARESAGFSGDCRCREWARNRGARRAAYARCGGHGCCHAGLNGIEAARQISARLPHTAIVFLGMHSDEGYVLKALKSGARAYLLKDSAENDLINAVKAVRQGQTFFSPAISKMMIEDYMLQMQQRAVEDSYDLLTTREREILQLFAEGKNNKDVANLLNLSLYTVETHRSNIFQKLNLHSSCGIDSVRRSQGCDQLD